MDERREMSLVLAHIKKYPKVDVHEMMEFLDHYQITVRDFSATMYKLLSSLVAEGESKDFQGEYDAVQLDMGTLVEMEHTTCSAIACKIAKDHLAEIPDYYTRLAAMETAAMAVVVEPLPTVRIVAKPIFRK